MINWFLQKISNNKRTIRTQDNRITPLSVDADAMKTIRRLSSHGHKAYIVGGAIRDTLLGMTPKDWDVVTSAHPGEIKKIFRNAYIIGRRFKLVHIHFANKKVIETATFRKHHGKVAIDTPIDDDNVFGTEHDDAFRRDFTINALFYDPIKDILIDHVGGLSDIRNRTLRCIGTPAIRLKEDPVRILRAIKFAAKFNLKIEKLLASEMVRHRESINLCSQRRLFEELAKILRSGILSDFITKASEYSFLPFFFPPLEELHKKHSQLLKRTADICDKLAREVPYDITLQYSLLLWPFINTKNEKLKDIQQATKLVFREFSDHFQMSKAERMRMRTLIVLLPRFTYILSIQHNGKKKAAHKKLISSQFYDAAFRLFKLTELAAKGTTPDSDAWEKMDTLRSGTPVVDTGSNILSVEQRPTKIKRRSI